MTGEQLIRIPASLTIRTDKVGDMDVIHEVIEQDCYQLQKLHLSGFRPKVVFDIGAHIGTFTVLARSLFPEAQFFCFEPNKDTFTRLKKNATFAKCYNAAVYYGDQSLQYVESIGATGGGFVAPSEEVGDLTLRKREHDNWVYEPNFDEITSITIDEVFQMQGFECIDLLKMDCEGGEWGIVENLSDDIAKTVKCVKGEFHTFNGRSRSEFEQLLKGKFPHLQFWFTGETHGLFGSI